MGPTGAFRHCLENESVDAKTLVDELPRLVAGPQTRGQGGSHRTQGIDDADWTVCIRSDQLMKAHEEMAQADLSSAEDVARVLGDLEEQLSDLARRQDAVEGRLRLIRQAIIGQYERGTVSARDWLG